MPNKLRQEASLYLRQHANDPVEWHPWGAEPLALAAEQNKPLFVSIGYSSCHWCHVMAKESFANETTAALMNKLFVNIKVDREQHPEVDAFFMNSIQVMGEGGGWPLSAFCIPNGTPYYMGTYFPPTDRRGMPSFHRTLEEMARVFHEERAGVEENAAAIIIGLENLNTYFKRNEKKPLTSELVILAGKKIVEQSDKVNGGLGGAPKFPSVATLELLRRASQLEFGSDAKEAFLLAAHGMATGGIFDHLGGGFARYSVDEKWTVPHFEKLLSDNAQLLSVMAEALAMTEDNVFRVAIEKTVYWLKSEMAFEKGGFFSGIDADSEGQEGAFYLFSKSEVFDVLGKSRGLMFASAHGVSEQGNFKGNLSVITGRKKPTNVYEQKELEGMRAELLAYRNKRVKPQVDQKQLAAWNALTISGLCRAYQVCGEKEYLDLAIETAHFLKTTMISGTQVYRMSQDGTQVNKEGVLRDYACVTQAMLDLAETMESNEWFQNARALCDSMLEKFYDDEKNVFWVTSSSDELLLSRRPESNQDGSIPAGASIAVDCLVRVGDCLAIDNYLPVIEAYLGSRLPGNQGTALACSSLLSALDGYLHNKVVYVTNGEGASELRQTAWRYGGASVVGEWLESSLSVNKDDSEGKAQAYLCNRGECRLATSKPEELLKMLKE